MLQVRSLGIFHMGPEVTVIWSLIKKDWRLVSGRIDVIFIWVTFLQKL